MVDLAGSECSKMAGGTKDQGLREARNINRSLAALADVMLALGRNQGSTGPAAASGADSSSFVPYRNSRLTHLLRDSIGGDAKMVLVLCLSATPRFVAESVQTLRFGTRARAVQKGRTYLEILLFLMFLLTGLRG